MGPNLAQIKKWVREQSVTYKLIYGELPTYVVFSKSDWERLCVESRHTEKRDFRLRPDVVDRVLYDRNLSEHHFYFIDNKFAQRYDLEYETSSSGWHLKAVEEEK